jgi:ABC-2 type transport system ATP-binding protein
MTEPYVVASGLSKQFGTKSVLEDLTLQVAPGDVVGVLGQNGAGKTTLLDVMLGFSPASGGICEVFGQNSFGLPAPAKARIGFVPQTDELVRQLRVRDHLRLIGSFYECWDDEFIARLTREWKLDLGERISDMSVGQRQKLSILLALGHHPDLLVLDEPVASLDPLARRQFLRELIAIAADGGRAVVFSSHIVSDIERLATKIWILKNRHLYWDGDFDSLKDSVVRIHVRANGRGLAEDSIPNLISIDRGEGYVSAVVQGWSDAAETQLRQSLGKQFDVEPLSLEEIFLELSA